MSAKDFPVPKMRAPGTYQEAIRPIFKLASHHDISNKTKKIERKEGKKK